MKLLITGGAGFIGINTALYFLDRGYDVHILDNLSRKGARQNLSVIAPYSNYTLHIADIRDKQFVDSLFEANFYDAVIHLAAQTTLIRSFDDPENDFSINAHGTLNLLEAIRRTGSSAIFLFSSTNKVYESIGVSDLHRSDDAYIYKHEKVDESFPLSRNESPYSCSKRVAEQYIQLYHQYYNVQTVAFRQSCIYGINQMGTEEQGWVAWFAIAAYNGYPIKLYGDGCQVRDVLYISDLIDVFNRAIEQIDRISGEVINIGGGPANSISLLKLIKILEDKLNLSIQFSFHETRPGDQLYYVSDKNRAEKLLGWKPMVGIDTGLSKLLDWVRQRKI